MSLLELAWRLARARSGRHLLTVAIVALGTGLMLATVATAEAGRHAVGALAARYPLVVGGEVGAVPLVLGATTRLQDPEGTIDAALADRLRDDPRVDCAVPLLAGHVVRGFPLLATTPAYLSPRERYPLARGRVFADGAADEVVLGADAARGLAAELGAELAIEHTHPGAPDAETRLTVVGVLEPTRGDADAMMFCALEAVFRSHGVGGLAHAAGGTAHGDGPRTTAHAHGSRSTAYGHGSRTTAEGRGSRIADHDDESRSTSGDHDHDREDDHDHDREDDHDHDREDDHDHDREDDHDQDDESRSTSDVHDHDRARPRISALLIRPTDDAALLSLQEELDALDGVSVALTGQTLRRIADRMSAGGRLLRLLVSGVLLITFLALLLAVYGGAMNQARDVAVLRLLGAGRLQVVATLGGVSLGVVAVGALGGWGIAELLAAVAEGVVRREMGLDADVVVLAPRALASLGGALGVLALAGVQPAIAAYTLQAAEALAELPGGGRATASYLRWSSRALALGAGLAFGLQAMSQHGGEPDPRPLDDASTALWATLSAGGTDAAAPAALDGTSQQLRGYMYALGDPYTVDDFYLVGLDPRLPRCPFCYRAPARLERVAVRGGGVSRDRINGQVEITGTLLVDLEADDPYTMTLERLEVVLE